MTDAGKRESTQNINIKALALGAEPPRPGVIPI
jgi:hypothetical protein